MAWFHVFWTCLDWPADGVVDIEADNEQDAYWEFKRYMEKQAELGAGPKNWRIEYAGTNNGIHPGKYKA